MRHVGFLVGFVLMAVPALAATKPKPPQKPLPPVRYVCEDGTRLAVALSAPGVTPATALLRILGTGKEIQLAQAPSADGGQFAAGTTAFWDKGQTATYTQGGVALTCRLKR